MVEKFAAVVVGAGPAGTAAAITMARAGVNVLVVERGDAPGGKNMFGGVVFRHAIEEIAGPGFVKDAPVERHVVEYRYMFLSKGSHVSVLHRNQRWNEEFNAFTALRARFDRWFASKIEEAGGILLTKTVAEDVIKEDGRVAGVKTDRGDVRADVVIAADGANSLLAKSSGLHGELSPSEVSLGVKEVIALPRERIEERFNLGADEGVAVLILGGPLSGMVAAGFLYTNKDTVSLGLGAILSDLSEQKKNPHDLLEEVKSHPSIQPLIEGGLTREYTARLIPEGGYRTITGWRGLYTDGMLVVGDAAMLVNLVNWEGSNMAMKSGQLAGQTVMEAKKQRDFSARTLSRYQQLLSESYVLRDLFKYRDIPRFIGSNRQFFALYPELANDVAYMWHLVDGTPKEERVRQIMRHVFSRRSRLGFVRDLYGVWRRVL